MRAYFLFLFLRFAFCSARTLTQIPVRAFGPPQRGKPRRPHTKTTRDKKRRLGFYFFPFLFSLLMRVSARVCAVYAHLPSSPACRSGCLILLTLSRRRPPRRVCLYSSHSLRLRPATAGAEVAVHPNSRASNWMPPRMRGRMTNSFGAPRHA